MKLLEKLFKYKYYLVIVLVGLSYFNQIFINLNKILASIDILYVFSPNKLFLTETIKNYLQLPLWNNLFFSGTPFLANPTSGLFYPLNYLFFLSKPEFIFGYLFVIDVVLIGIFTFMYSKSIKLTQSASLLSAIIFMLSGSVITRIYPGHLFIVDAIVWFPLTLYFVEKILETKKLIYCFAASISISLMFFAGHTQITFYSLLIISLYFIFRTLFEYKKSNNLKNLLRYFQLFFLIIITFAGLSAVQLLPTLEFSRLLTRSEGVSLEFASNFSLHPYQIISFILPTFYGTNINNTFWGIGNIWETAGYLGVISLIFAFLAIFFKRNKYILIFSFFALFSVLFSLGKNFFLFPLLFNYFPFMDNFRVPSRMLFVYSFSVAILAGLGFDYLLKVKENFKNFKLFNFSILFLLILSLGVIIYFLNTNGFSFYEKYVLKNSYAVGIDHNLLYNQFLSDITIFSVLLLLYLIIIYLFLNKRITQRIFTASFLLIIVSNLYFYGHKLIVMEFPEKIYSNPNIVNLIKSDDQKFRVFDVGSDYIVYSTRNNLEYVTGIEAGIIIDYRDLILLAGEHQNVPYESFFLFKSINSETVLNLFNTKYIVSDKLIRLKDFETIQKDNYKLFNQNKVVYLYKNNNLLPRAYVVSSSRITKDKKETLSLIKENKVDFRKEVLLEQSSLAQKITGSTFTVANIDYYSPNKINLNVSIKEKGFLVLSEIWYPGWKATDNGEEVGILKANYLFRAIALEKGTHKISFSYDPFSFKIGALISFLTAILVTLTYILIFRKKVIKFLYSFINKN